MNVDDLVGKRVGAFLSGGLDSPVSLNGCRRKVWKSFL